jgi:hypothetical protein
VHAGSALMIFVLLLLFAVEKASASNWRISQLVDKCPDRNAHLYFSVVSFLEF